MPALGIALIGTRGVPAQYGGFETAVEEIGRRLADRGHQVRVYCRNPGQTTAHHRGMELVNLAALHLKVGETLSHTALSLLHCRRHPVDAAIVFNAANSVLLPLLGTTPVALHMDGLESRREKWGRWGRRYYLSCERLAVRRKGPLIADAVGIQRHFLATYGRETVLLRYGMPAAAAPDKGILAEFGLEEKRYHLLVARMEPENHVLEAVEAHARQGSAALPLVVVGDAPYAQEYKAAVLGAAGPNAKLIGSVYDQAKLDVLYAGAGSYVHGHSVGGTNPSLLRAIAHGVPVVAHDNVFNREVAGPGATYWQDVGELTKALDDVEVDTGGLRELSGRWREQVRTVYDWDAVTDGYEELLLQLAGRAHW